jgi:hypothetical protein
MNIEYPNGHIGELQIHLKPILVAKDLGHKFYEEVRDIEDNAKIEGRVHLTEEEQATIDVANAKMRDLYDRAWKKAIGRIAGMSRRASKGVEYFMYDGEPAKLIRRQVPVVLVGRKFKRFYDFEKFHREAEPISEMRYKKELVERF